MATSIANLIRAAKICPQIRHPNSAGPLLRKSPLNKTFGTNNLYEALLEREGIFRVAIVAVEKRPSGVVITEQCDPIPERFRRWDYLPERSDILDYFTSNDRLWMPFTCSAFNRQFEIFNQEFINALAGYLKERIMFYYQIFGEPVTIIEDGAGNGRLSHFLKLELERSCPGAFQIIPIDPGAWNITQFYPVERSGYCSEYILIGKIMSCGDQWLSWGVPRESSTEPKPYTIDGFRALSLDEVHRHQICREDNTDRNVLVNLTEHGSRSCSDAYAFIRQ